MYRNFLLKHKFWPDTKQKREGKPTVYLKHDDRIGGIYAYIVNKGVKIVVDDEVRFFNNFDHLERYLEKLYLRARSQEQVFNSLFDTMQRRTQSKLLRQLPI